MKKTLLVVACLVLIACSNMPVSSIWKLKSEDPLTINPADITIIARLSAVIDFDQAVMQLQLGFHPEEPGVEERVEYYDLQISKNQRIPAWITAASGPDEALYRMALSAQDAKRMRAMQLWIKQQNEMGVKNKKSFGVHIRKFCLTSKNVPGPLLANVYINLNPDEDFLLLLKNLRLDEQDFDWEKALCSEVKNPTP